MLECDEGEVKAQIAALRTLVQAVAGTVHITEITSTCLALAITAPSAAMPRLEAGLKLGGAVLAPFTAALGDRIAVILTVRQSTPKDHQ